MTHLITIKIIILRIEVTVQMMIAIVIIILAAITTTVEARKLEYDCPPTLKPREEGNQAKSSQIHIPTFCSLLHEHFFAFDTPLGHTSASWHPA